MSIHDSFENVENVENVENCIEINVKIARLSSDSSKLVPKLNMHAEVQRFGQFRNPTAMKKLIFFRCVVVKLNRNLAPEG